ncbi:TPA: hypothetical protein L3869_006512 [Pseudomonas aeruginosa]|nr:hypothetical protein [Pseudomonas aeruginosa]
MSKTIDSLQERSEHIRKEIIERYSNLLAVGDVEGILKLYHPDAEIVPHGLPSVSGINDIRKFYVETFRSIKIHGALSVLSLFQTNDICCVRCEEPAIIEDKKTKNKVHTYFRELFVIKECCDGWKIQFYFFSENPSQAVK